MKENIFSNFYTKVLSFFTTGKEEGETARNTAQNRLKLVLMQDRSNLDGATMQKMREQLISVISKYIEIDTEALDLNLEGDGEEIALMLNIPVIRARTKEEIDEIEAKEIQDIEDAKKAAIEEALKAKEEENNSDSDEEKELSEEISEEKENEEIENEEEVVQAETSEENQEELTENDKQSESEADEIEEEEKSEEPKKQKKNKNK